MPTAAQIRFSGNTRVMPFYKADRAEEQSVALAPSTTYAKGTVLGQITSAAVSDVQTVTVDASTHSTITFTNLPGGFTYTAPQDITPAALQTALNALLGPNSVVVTGTYAAGSGGTYIITAGTGLGGEPLAVIGVSGTFVGGSSPAVANVHTTTGVGPTLAFRAYASGNTDGSQIPKAILQYACTTDYLGNITILGEFGQTWKTAPAWMSGYFRIQDLVGLDANAVTLLAANIVSGTLTSTTPSGVIHF